MRQVSYASARECARSPALGRARCVSCARSPTYVRTHALSFHRTYVRTYVRKYVRTYVRTNFTRGASCAESRMYVRTCARAYVRTYVLTCVTRVGARVCAASVIASAQAPYRPGKVKECLPQATADQPGDSGGFASPCQKIALVCVFLLCMQGNSRRFGHVRTYVLRNLMSRPHRPPSWRARPWQRTCADHSAAAFHQRFTTMNVSYVRT